MKEEFRLRLNHIKKYDPYSGFVSPIFERLKVHSSTVERKIERLELFTFDRKIQFLHICNL